jgi:hypothetical protein
MENECAETPLIELLRDVPKDARLEIEVNPTHHKMIPVGVHCHRAAEKLAAARKAMEHLREAAAWCLHCTGHHDKDNRPWRDLPDEERELWRKKVDASAVELVKNGAIAALAPRAEKKEEVKP